MTDGRLSTAEGDGRRPSVFLEPDGFGALQGRMIDALVAGAFVVVFAVHLVSQMTLSFWHDEAFTYLNFINPGLSGALLSDYHANNHRAFSILAVVARRVAGESDGSLRLASVLPAVAAVVVLTVWMLRSKRPWSAPIAAGLLAASPLLAYWLPQGRGYGLALFASVLLLVGTVNLLAARSRSNWVIFVAAGVVGTVTLPHFAVVFVLAGASVLAAHHDEWRGVVTALFVAGAITFPFYIAGGIGNLIESSSREGRGPAIQPIDIVIGPFRFWIDGTLDGTGTLSELVGGTARPWVLAMLGVMYTAGLVWLLCRDRALLLVLSIPVHGFFAVGVLVGFESTDRAALFMLPWVVVTASFGIGAVGDRRLTASVPVMRVLWAPAVLLLIVAVVFCLRLSTSWSATPIEAMRETVQIAHGAGIDTVVTDSSRPHGLHRYDPEIQVLAETEIYKMVCDGSGAVVYIEHRFSRSWDAPSSCLEARGAHFILTEQRRRGSLVVWIVPGT